MIGIRAYLFAFFTSWVAVDRNPQPSNLDRLDGVR